MKNLIFNVDIENKNVVVQKTVEASIDLVWKIFSSGELMAKWWGPKTWPASSVSFDFRPGGHWHYFMQGPDGTRSYGWSGYLEISEKKEIILNDIFCDEKGIVNNEMPKTLTRIRFESLGDETEIIFESTYDSVDDIKKVVELGFQAGFTDALDNLDTLVEEMKKTNG